MGRWLVEMWVDSLIIVRIDWVSLSSCSVLLLMITIDLIVLIVLSSEPGLMAGIG
jgi:hypothetical protein